MELPREIQIYIYRFLYDKWRLLWNKVMKELLTVEIETKLLAFSGLFSKRWNKIRTKICLDCGNYYRIPMYSSVFIACSCD